jgi:hypothetical protein
MSLVGASTQHKGDDSNALASIRLRPEAATCNWQLTWYGGTPVFPLWPAEEYARACATNEWSAYQPRSIELSRLTAELLPRLRDDGVLPCVFFTPTSQGVTPSVDDLLAALDAESAKY